MGNLETGQPTGMIIKPLTSMRFVFALMVFAHHLRFINPDDETLNWLYRNVFYEGYIGVTFFFILSGFIIAYRYQRRLLDGQGTIYQFLTARLAKVYPLHLLTLIIAMPPTLHELWEGKIITWLIKFFSNLTLTQSFITSSPFFFSFNAPSWAISNEVFYYLMFPAIVPLFGGAKFSAKKYLLLLPVAAIPPLMLFIDGSRQHDLFYIHPVFRLADFIIGIFLYHLYERFKAAPKVPFTALEWTSVLVFALFFAFHNRIPQVFRYSCYYWLPMGAVILVFAYQRGFLSVILSNRRFMFLGELSFCFYLIHSLVIRYFVYLDKHLFKIGNDYVITLCIFSITMTASYLAFIGVERPCSRYIRILSCRLKWKRRPDVLAR